MALDLSQSGHAALAPLVVEPHHATGSSSSGSCLPSLSRQSVHPDGSAIQPIHRRKTEKWGRSSGLQQALMRFVGRPPCMGKRRAVPVDRANGPDVLRIVHRGVHGSGSTASRGSCARGSSSHFRLRTSHRNDTPERGGEVQQPVQQRAPNDGESRRTSAKYRTPLTCANTYQPIAVTLANVTGGQGVAASNPVSPTVGKCWSGAVSGDVRNGH